MINDERVKTKRGVFVVFKVEDYYAVKLFHEHDKEAWMKRFKSLEEALMAAQDYEDSLPL